MPHCSKQYTFHKADSAQTLRLIRQETSMAEKEHLGETETQEGDAYAVETGTCILRII